MKLLDLVNKIASFNMELDAMIYYRDLFINPSTWKELNYLVAFQTLIRLKETEIDVFTLKCFQNQDISYNPFIN